MAYHSCTGFSMALISMPSSSNLLETAHHAVRLIRSMTLRIYCSRTCVGDRISPLQENDFKHTSAFV